VLVAELVVLALPGGPGFVDALRRVWDNGDAAFPLDPRYPPPLARAILDSLAPAWIVGADGERVSRPGGRPVDDGDALVVATSGSTGEPKGVVLTHEAVAASAWATSERLGVEPARDVWLACLPLAHVGGLSVVTRALVTATPLKVLPRFDPDAVLASEATLVSLVPVALRRIDPAPFRWIVLGGSAPPAALPANVVTTYGMTETGSGVVYDGVPLNGVEVRVDNHAQISLRGPMLLRAYRDGFDPKDREGWFATGDLGAWDATTGRLTVYGRQGDLIITGGENVWPEPVERVLLTHPGVADVAVAGLDDPEWGQVVTAYLVPADAGAIPTLDELRTHSKSELPAHCAPRRVVVVTTIPRTALGKIRRNELVG
jgi:O-succinylbenzoic acid--CoA ligase